MPNLWGLLQELRQIAPDIWEGRKRRLILPQKLGDFEKQEYVDSIQNMIRKLNEHTGLLDAGLIGEAEYESLKADVLCEIRTMSSAMH